MRHGLCPFLYWNVNLMLGCGPDQQGIKHERRNIFCEVSVGFIPRRHRVDAGVYNSGPSYPNVAPVDVAPGTLAMAVGAKDAQPCTSQETQARLP